LELTEFFIDRLAGAAELFVCLQILVSGRTPPCALRRQVVDLPKKLLLSLEIRRGHPAIFRSDLGYGGGF
jgi:hypothetical protein